MRICQELGIKQLILDTFYPEEDSPVVRRQISFLDFKSVESAIFDFCGSNKVDCVVSIQSIEHLTKNDGELLLSNIEKWARKLVIFETPNGFVEQGAIGGNIHQIHLSGWSIDNFKSRGYKIIGTVGLKILKKASNKGQYKLPIRGMKLLDVILTRISFIQYFPKASFCIFAYKVLD